MLYASIRRIAARNLLATLIAITILIGIPSSGHAQDSAAPAAQQDVAKPGGGTETSTSSDRLRSLIDEALSRSPIVLAARSHWQAQTKVPIQAATIPDPQVSLQHFTVGSPQPFSGYESSDFYYTGFGVSQDIPGPGKLRLQKSEAEKDAEYARRRYEAAEREVEEKVKETYFELFYHAKTLEILNRNQAELRQIQQIIETRYRLGQRLQQDLIKAQLQSTEFLKEHAMHHQEEDQAQLELKQILGRDPDSPNIDIGGVAATHLQLDPSQLAQLADSGSPDLAADRAMETRSAEALKLAHQGYWPDFTVGYSYQKTGPGFRDYYMLNLGAKVPLYFWRKQTPAIEQAALEAESARAQTRATQLQVSSFAESSLVAMRTAERTMSIYRDGLIPQAQTSEASAMAAYRVGKVDFQTLLSSVLDLQNLRQEYYRSLADHEIAIAKIQQVIGDQR
ncbi:TolC family protein [Candidatus Binatus soli]|jgi:outer membrane protein TolC|uniref:TolC family protein n=1 Tax=Candidatus Binatus soli TaxID=1953413 RepID=UPI003D0F5A17